VQTPKLRDAKTMIQIVLNTPMLDWLTITTYDDMAAKAWWRIVTEGESEEKKIMQYDGRIRFTLAGSIFVGSGYQRRGLHHMVRVSGTMADEHKSILYAQLKQGTIRVSRMDVQCTIRKPKEWNQWRFFNRRKRAGKTVAWFQSSDRDAGELATVYIGSRRSDRFTRVYEKPSAGGVKLLRVETEYKRDRAHKSAKAMMDGKGFTPGAMIRHELDNSISDDKLHALFSPHCGDRPASVKVHVKTDDDKTFRWLVDDVLPVFKRIAYSHDMGDLLIEEYGKIIQGWIDSEGLSP
jgi:hypothetical protein